MLAGFNWFIANILAGSARPGLLDELDHDLEFLAGHKIARIVTLTERPLPESPALANFELIHFPIPDMGIPTPRACAQLCARIVDGLEQRPALLHCRGGLGRTGTIAACCLVNLGRAPEAALSAIRAINPNYVQNTMQARFISHYADHLGQV